jgi:hypothetical protein
VSSGAVARSVSRATGTNVSLIPGLVAAALVFAPPGPPSPPAAPSPPALPPPPFSPPVRLSCDSAPCYPGVRCFFPTPKQAALGALRRCILLGHTTDTLRGNGAPVQACCISNLVYCNMTAV